MPPPLPAPKTVGEIDAMAASGALLASALETVCRAATPGVRTADLDGLAEEILREGGGVPAFKGYMPAVGAVVPFPSTVCTSVNDEVAHGMPGGRILEAGDLLSLDIGVALEGWYTDSARTIPVGPVDAASHQLCATTEAALEAGIGAIRVGGHLGDIGHAVQQVIEAAGYAVVRAMVGHGIGRAMHEPPDVPHVGRPGTGARLVEGLVLAVEPMATLGRPEVVLGIDGWTMRTCDGSRCAHFEHTVAVTARGPMVLTRLGG